MAVGYWPLYYSMLKLTVCVYRDGGLKRGKVKDTLKEQQQKMYSSMVVGEDSSGSASDWLCHGGLKPTWSSLALSESMSTMDQASKQHSCHRLGVLESLLEQNAISSLSVVMRRINGALHPWTQFTLIERCFPWYSRINSQNCFVFIVCPE